MPYIIRPDELLYGKLELELAAQPVEKVGVHVHEELREVVLQLLVGGRRLRPLRVNYPHHCRGHLHELPCFVRMGVPLPLNAQLLGAPKDVHYPVLLIDPLLLLVPRRCPKLPELLFGLFAARLLGQLAEPLDLLEAFFG